MAKDQDVLSIVIRKLGQQRIYSPEQMIERLGTRPINHYRVTILPVASVAFSLTASSISEEGADAASPSGATDECSRSG